MESGVVHSGPQCSGNHMCLRISSRSDRRGSLPPQTFWRLLAVARLNTIEAQEQAGRCCCCKAGGSRSWAGLVLGGGDVHASCTCEDEVDGGRTGSGGARVMAAKSLPILVWAALVHATEDRMLSRVNLASII